MKKLNIAKIIDQIGWAYYFLDMEQQKYSRHNIVIQKYNQIDFNDIDLFYIHSPDIWWPDVGNLSILAKEKGLCTIGGYAGEVNYLWPCCVDAIATISPQMLKYAKSCYNDKTVLFLPESIDDSFFYPKKIKHDGFVVGFAGRLAPVKRPHILDALKYPVIKKCDHGEQFFIHRTLEPMRDFYNSIDALVLVSKTECMPRVVMEAMACGIPVVSTNAGCIPMMIDKEWIVDSESDEIIIKQMNEKLEKLENDIVTRLEVGLKNRKRIETHLSWKVNATIWDDIFEAVYEGNYALANEISIKSIKILENI
jgi:glycosyltransferase involved in cell wall biosynthesis